MATDNKQGTIVLYLHLSVKRSEPKTELLGKVAGPSAGLMYWNNSQNLVHSPESRFIISNQLSQIRYPWIIFT